MGLSALSHSLVREDLAGGTLKTVTMAGWPLKRKIRIVQLKKSYVSKAIQHFLLLARKRIAKVRFLEAADAVLPGSRGYGRTSEGSGP